MSPHLSTQDVYAICARCGCDVKTVEKVLRGRSRVRGVSYDRIAAAVRELGFEAHLPAREDAVLSTLGPPIVKCA